ncbi:MAG TPA: MgtC/SapB family protein [Pseudonocardiaceae bacterium]
MSSDRGFYQRMTTAEMLLRLVVALAVGGAIGVERQWRARMAGLRTNVLVATGAALYVLLSAYGFPAAPGGAAPDPTRVTAQIVSGIGFLGAGVILRDGLNVRGLNTAASLWCSAAVGSLAGAGMYAVAAGGTAAVIVANVALRPLARRIDRHPAGGDEIGVTYWLEAVCARSEESHVRALMVQIATDPVLRLRAIRRENTGTDHQVSLTADFSAESRVDHRLEQAVTDFAREPTVIAVSWAAGSNTDGTADLRIESASGGRNSGVASWCVRSPLVRNRAPRWMRPGSHNRDRL